MDDQDWTAAGQVEVLISALEHYGYCPRQCGLIHVEQTFDENLYTIKGQIVHERVDSGEQAPSRGLMAVRAIPLWSAGHGLRGKADLVEFQAGVPFPVEFKLGVRKDDHPDLQLCAEAFCLEEMLGVAVPKGAIYYATSRQRHEVAIDAELRTRTLAVVAAIRAMLVSQRLPEAVNDKRCRNCSLIHSCMPKVVGEPARLRGLQGALFTPMIVGGKDGA